MSGVMAPATHILMESGWEGTLGQFQSSLKIAEQAAFRNQLPKFILFPEDLSRDRVVMDSSSVLLLIHCSTVSRAESLSPTLPALNLGFQKKGVEIGFPFFVSNCKVWPRQERTALEV